MISRGNTRRIAIALLLGGALLISYPAVSGGLGWDLGAACGYICIVLVVFLYVYPVRGDGLPHARLLGLSQHKSIGWCVLGTAVAHVVVLLLVEPRTGRYLLPSAPVFMWCGIVAMLAVVALVIAGLSARAAVSPRATMLAAQTATSRATLHIAIAALLTLTASAHIIGSAQLLSGHFKLAVVLVLLSLPLAAYAARRRRERPRHVAQPNGRPIARPASHIAAVVIILLLPTPAAKHLLLEPATRPGPIAVSFPHDSHTSVSCVTCHHNYLDHTGTTACVECHRSARTDLPHSSEATFHTFCRDCHVQLTLDGAKHGPTRSCSACHQGTRSSSL